MAAPDNVPTRSTAPRSYRSPDVVPASWSAARPAALGVAQPLGAGLGHQGPDQGYALSLTRRFDERLVLVDREHRPDVYAGAVQIAMKRASMYGRAPMIHDIEIALRVWGFLDDAPDDLIAARRCFEGVANPHHWRELRAVVDMVPFTSLSETAASVASAHGADWRALLDLS